MTIKQAFEKLTMVCGAALKNPFFVQRNLHDAFADIAANIEEGGGGASSAEDVSYDNTDSGLTATDVQAAIDEIVAEMPSGRSHNYSTTEQVVGKWIDGTTDVCEIVLTGISLSLNGSEWVIYSGVDYIAQLIGLDCFATVDGALVRCAISEYRPSPANGIQVSGFSGMNRTIDTMIVRYIKKVS